MYKELQNKYKIMKNYEKWRRLQYGGVLGAASKVVHSVLIIVWYLFDLDQYIKSLVEVNQAVKAWSY